MFSILDPRRITWKSPWRDLCNVSLLIAWLDVFQFSVISRLAAEKHSWGSALRGWEVGVVVFLLEAPVSYLSNGYTHHQRPSEQENDLPPMQTAPVLGFLLLWDAAGHISTVSLLTPWDWMQPPCTTCSSLSTCVIFCWLGSEAINLVIDLFISS